MKRNEVDCPVKVSYVKVNGTDRREIILNCGPCGRRRLMRFSVTPGHPMRRGDPPLPDNLTDAVDQELAQCPKRDTSL